MTLEQSHTQAIDVQKVQAAYHSCSAVELLDSKAKNEKPKLTPPRYLDPAGEPELYGCLHTAAPLGADGTRQLESENEWGRWQYGAETEHIPVTPVHTMPISADSPAHLSSTKLPSRKGRGRKFAIGGVAAAIILSQPSCAVVVRPIGEEDTTVPKQEPGSSAQARPPEAIPAQPDSATEALDPEANGSLGDANSAEIPGETTGIGQVVPIDLRMENGSDVVSFYIAESDDTILVAVSSKGVVESVLRRESDGSLQKYSLGNDPFEVKTETYTQNDSEASRFPVMLNVQFLYLNGQCVAWQWGFRALGEKAGWQFFDEKLHTAKYFEDEWRGGANLEAFNAACNAVQEAGGMVVPVTYTPEGPGDDSDGGRQELLVAARYDSNGIPVVSVVAHRDYSIDEWGRKYLLEENESDGIPPQWERQSKVGAWTIELQDSAADDGSNDYKLIAPDRSLGGSCWIKDIENGVLSCERKVNGNLPATLKNAVKDPAHLKPVKGLVMTLTFVVLFEAFGVTPAFWAWVGAP